jgi:hypothetical protein
MPRARDGDLVKIRIREEQKEFKVHEKVVIEDTK